METVIQTNVYTNVCIYWVTLTNYQIIKSIDKIDRHVDMVSAVWSNQYSTQTPGAIACTKQKSWDEASVKHGLEIIESHCADDVM